ncbi:Splicing factor 45 [Coelomomyces lativittatus]|nr:Splicing factor 45 [Coelomomyces lativittatus]KAJ1497795.1 Splicing factor 45 [Coelomomyces lativittatus]
MEGTGDQDQLLQALLSQLEKMSSSRVVLLCNMVDPGDVDDDLKVETAEECSKFGKVLQCYVHEIVGPQLPSDAVRIFVEFDKPEAAQQAISELNGRFFSGRKVTARLYDNHSFHQHAYEE